MVISEYGQDPTRVPSGYVAPRACAASSTTTAPASSAAALIAGMSQGSPAKWTGKTARTILLPRKTSRRLSGDMSTVSGSTSANSGRPPAYNAAFDVATNVIGDVTSAFPGPTP